MPSTTRLSHRHQPSDISFSSTSSTSSTRPALPQILSNSASNAVHLSRSTAPTSRRVRSHWFTHFVFTWRRTSRSSKLWLGLSMSFLAIQLITCIAVLYFSWEMYCDKPLRVFVTVYILRQVLMTPITIYLHLIPRRIQHHVSPRTSARNELSEAYALSLRNRPVSFPPPVVPHQNHPYPPFVIQQPPVPSNPSSSTANPSRNESSINPWIERAKSALDFFAVLWFIIGNYMLFSSTTCSATAQPLYYLSLGLIVYGYLILCVPILLCTSVIFCLPCVLVGMRLLHVDDGVSMGGATPEEIAMIPIFQFKTKDILTTEARNNTQLSIEMPIKKQQPKLSRFDKFWLYLGLIDPPPDIEPEYELLEIIDVQDQLCVICLSPYEDGDMLCKLWCQHHFHKVCVHEWLALNYRCPMCKQDSRGKDFMLDV